MEAVQILHTPPVSADIRRCGVFHQLTVFGSRKSRDSVFGVSVRLHLEYKVQALYSGSTGKNGDKTWSKLLAKADFFRG
jgi:hypothetical protein